jgi:hypothetical protein
MANQPVIETLSCLVCGGKFFVKSRAERYQKAGYGTAEFRSIDTAAKTILQCIGCLTPVTPQDTQYARGTVAQAQEGDFRQSILAGQAYRKNNSIQAVVESAASIQEVQELKSQLTALTKKLNDLTPKTDKSAKSGKTNADATTER